MNKRRQRRLQPQEIDELVAAYQAGEMIADLVSRFGIGRSTVKAHLRRQGVSGRPYRHLHGDVPARAQELYAAGWSPRALAAELGIGREAHPEWAYTGWGASASVASGSVNKLS